MPHSASPADPTAGFVVDQIAETLITLDCHDRVKPSLAISWTTEDGGRTWLFRLRRDARFHDGSPVTAGDVARSLTAAAAHTQLGGTDALVGWAGIRSALVKGDTAIELQFDRAHRSVPRALAHSALVVVQQNPSGRVGSGPFRVAGASDDEVELASGPNTVLTSWTRGDPRDAIDLDVDLLLTDDARTLAYAAELDAYRTIPLAWRGVYVLAMPQLNQSLAGAVDDPYLPGLVGTAAQRPSGAEWWHAVDCEMPPTDPPPAAATLNQRLVYRSDDPIARSIAERLSVLTSGRSGERLIAVPLDTPAFDRAVRQGRDAGYVLPLPRAPLAPCLPLGTLLQQAPWLEISSDAGLHAVVETRSFAIVRPERVAGRLELGWGGAVRILSGTGR